MADIGDYVISDCKITSVEKINTYANGYDFVGNGFGGVYNSFNEVSRPFWYSRKSNRLATIADLEIFAQAIRKNAKDIHRPEVKEFMKRATEWILINDFKNW